MADLRSLISQIPMEPGYVPAPPEPDLSVIQRLMGLPQTLRAVGQNLAVGAASLPVGIYQGFGDPSAGEAAMSQFQQEYGYTPTNPAAQRQLQGLGEFLQQLETEYKIPPMISPSQLPSRAATAGSAMQLGRIGTRMTGQAQDLARDLVREIQTTPPTGAVTMGSKSAELSALKARLDELNNQFATDTAPPSAVREHGAVMKRYLELQDELYPRPQRTPMVQEPDVPQGLLPEQASQEISKAVAQRDVVQTDNFKNWFGDWQVDPTMASKVVDESGLPKIVFHGTQRPDRIGAQFRKSRATSGPMSFFTDDPEIASGYAKGKRDTSLAYEDTDYANWFKKKEGRSTLNLDQVGARMSSQERQEVLDKLRRVGQDDQGNIVMGEPLVSDQTFDFMLRDPREAGGNPLKLANKLWLESGTLYGREEDFSKVLKAIGVKGFEEDFPTSTYPAVYPVYLDIKNPLSTMQIDQGTLDALETASKRQRKPRAMGGADQWDKRMRDPQQWMSQLKEDVAKGENSMVWTSIPDWVTNTLKKQGFDGIEDVGGKSFGSPHTVWIPFEETQIKSATGNVGAFSKESKNILRGAAPAVGAGLLGAGMMQEEEQF